MIGTTRHPALCSKTAPLGIFRQALSVLGIENRDHKKSKRRKIHPVPFSSSLGERLSAKLQDYTCVADGVPG
jgi:hypothetical protein